MLLKGQYYRLSSATFGIRSSDGQRTPIKLTAGTVFKIIEESTDGSGFVDVLWEDKLVTMFLQDIMNRGERIEG